MYCRQEIKRTSTLPPLCCHGPKPLPYVWPKYGCPPIQECPPLICCYPTNSCPPLVCDSTGSLVTNTSCSNRISYELFGLCIICRPRPEPPSRPPTLCIAGPCPALAGPFPPYCPTSHCQKIISPASCVRYCIRSTCGESTYAPCYSSNLPKCPRTDCC
ncbi:DBF4-type zinc finger-containing protein 2 homolog [Hylaeus volcanicus]|uniref:DBF4-type zinc finger-containing protein 2 homolog n=1 Tax=Hylaeus volcanicus TaxID=313075 RepID=UPI0023B81856|nr:DBF4-type zinc finger-containing protein 2 homolog [Hylaeus volcanicus]